MTPRRKCWAETVGGYGYRVRLYESKPGGILWLRWWEDGRAVKETLGHRDREAGREAAKDKSAALLTRTTTAPRLSVQQLFQVYQREVSRHRKGQQPAEHARRIALWTAFLGAETELRTLDYPTLDRFVRLRRAGAIAVPKHDFGPVAESTIGADLVFLQAVLNWATRRRVGPKPLLLVNPVRGYQRPRTPKPLRPVATETRYHQLLRAHPDPLWRSFLTIVHDTGWRVSALCQLRASDFDFRATKTAPFGRIQKRAATDKEGVFQWVQITQAVRDAARGIIRSRKLVGDAYLFTRRRKKDQPWTKRWALTLLARAEDEVGLEHLPRGGFHMFRRAWAIARKHHPDADVAEAAGYADTRTLKTIYQQADELTMLRVVTEPAKVEEA